MLNQKIGLEDPLNSLHIVKDDMLPPRTLVVSSDVYERFYENTVPNKKETTDNVRTNKR
jgi:hypothetical protein